MTYNFNASETTAAKPFLIRLWMFMIFLLMTTCAHAVPVQFWFSGTIFQSTNPSNAVPSGIGEGGQITGYVYYESTGYNSTYFGGGFGDGYLADYYFNSNSDFKFTFQAGGHTFSITNGAGYVGLVQIDDAYGNNDSFIAESGGSTVMLMDGAPLAIPSIQTYASLYLRDSSKSAYNSTNLPTTAPTLAMFPTYANFQLFARYLPNSATVMNVNAQISYVGSKEQVMLNQQVFDGVIRLSWPLVANGFTLQSRTNLTTDVWQDVAMPVVNNATDHTVTLPVSGNKYFRLKK